jgi:cyclic pyranopterin phosphate synthase
MGLNHFDNKGNAVMVDVSDKDITERIATAEGKIKMNNTAMEAVVNGTSKKGDVLNVARVAGIMAAKKTFEIIPMCHLLMLTKCSVDFEIEKNYVVAKCTVKTKGKTGVEMEALTGVNVALLTIYDMLKAVDRSMEITDIRLLYKNGGKSGEYKV